jgi:hypothetical protein
VYYAAKGGLVYYRSALIAVAQKDLRWVSCCGVRLCALFSCLSLTCFLLFSTFERQAREEAKGKKTPAKAKPTPKSRHKALPSSESFAIGQSVPLQSMSSNVKISLSEVKKEGVAFSSPRKCFPKSPVAVRTRASAKKPAASVRKLKWN